MPAGPARLKKRPQFLEVAAANRKFVTHGVIVQLLKRPDRGLRIGFTVSKKVGNAVARNRARRRLREAAAETLRDYHSIPYDLVLIGRTATLTRSWDELRGDLRFAFTKLGILQ